MSTAAFGLIHGNTITLERPFVELDGQRVRVVIEPAGNAEIELSADQNASLWQSWVQKGPQGPIDGGEFPDEP